MRGIWISAAIVLGVMTRAGVADAQTTTEVGPTLDAQAMTAGELIRAQPSYSPTIHERHAAYEREMALALGIPTGGGALDPGMQIGFVHDMGRWMAMRWGESVFNNWARSAALTYSWIEESATIRAHGFDMGVDVDDVARGRFGVRLNRALE